VSRYFIHLSYFGKNFNGWQVQKNSERTVQQCVQEALSTVFQEPIEVVGCGRTDAGVHAKSYYAHFDSAKDNLHIEKKKWLNKLNKVISPDIAFYDLRKVKEDASARFEAVSRSYQYFIHAYKDPFLTELSWQMGIELDIAAMNEAAQILFEYRDFTSFSKVNTQTHTNNCEIFQACWGKKDNRLVFHISANRFLRNMVRAIVGTLLQVGEKKISIKEFREIIESKNRSNAGKSVPAHGLYLTEIVYPGEIFCE
jgi:tRNA pseudouridine38-40 synthase